MKILVTGATSMIGRHVINLLKARGDDITVMQRRNCGIEGVNEVCFDIAQTVDLKADTDHTLQHALSGCDAVIHLAAKVSIAGRWEDFEAINVIGAERLAIAAKQCGVKRFVHISTPSVAHAGKSLVGESAGVAEPSRVRGHYARSKALGEQRMLAANSHAMKVVALRPHLVWGPGDTQLVQRIIERARAGRLVLVGSGLALIDTTYVDNAASAIVAALDNIEQAAGHALVISNGQPRTVSEIMQRILRCAGLPTTLRTAPASVAIAAGTAIEHVWEAMNKQGDPPMTRFLAEQLATAHWFDQRTTQRLLDWSPSVTLEEGFQRLAAAQS